MGYMDRDRRRGFRSSSMGNESNRGYNKSFGLDEPDYYRDGNYGSDYTSYDDRSRYSNRYDQENDYGRNVNSRYGSDYDRNYNEQRNSGSNNEYSSDDNTYGNHNYGGYRNRGQYSNHSNYGGRSRYDTDRNYGYGNREERDWWDKTSDEVSSWFGDEDARRRRDLDKINSHKGKGPKGYRRSDERIKEDINDRLSDDPYVDATDVDVNVENGDVTLTGSVDERNSKRRAEYIAESVSGVGNVENRIRVKQFRTEEASENTIPSSGTERTPRREKTYKDY